MSTEFVAIISSLFTAVIGPIVVSIVKDKLEKRAKKDLLNESLKENAQIIHKLEEIKASHKADRAWITQFHNGGNFYPTGKSIQKFSMCYETVDKGAYSIQQNFQNIPISLFSKSINHLLEHDIITIPDYKDETVATYGLKYIAEENGCKSGYMFAIKSIDGKFIGILGIDYTRRKSVLSEEELNTLLVEATTIGGVLYPKK